MTPNGQYATLDNDSLIGLFDSIYEQSISGVWASRVGMLVPSDSAAETYGWLGAPAQLEELKGDITEEQLAQFNYTLRNVEYAKSIKFAEKDMRRDKIGQIQARLGDFAMKAASHWNVLGSTLISSNGNSYDGTTFFSATHAESGTNQVNELTNAHVSALDITTAASPTADEAAKAIVGVLGKFYELTDNKGDEINGEARSFLIMVHTAAQWAAFSHAINGDRLSGGEANRVLGLTSGAGLTLELVLNPRLKTATTQFEVFRMDGSVKPFVLQEEVPIEPMVTDRNSDEFKKYRRFLFSLYTSRAAGYGRWQSAMRATFS